MRFLGYSIFMIAALAVNAATAEDGVLYWMIDSSATVTQTEPGSEPMPIADYFGTFGSGSDFAARVRVTGGDLVEDMFLDLYYPDGADVGSGEWGALFDGDSVGTPHGSQVSVPSTFSAESPEYSFIVEIGNVTEDEWTVIARSPSETYTSLVASRYIIPLGDIDTPSSHAIWTPTQFQAVPEPSGGLLVLIGTALLALRRRRMAQTA